MPVHGRLPGIDDARWHGTFPRPGFEAAAEIAGEMRESSPEQPPPRGLCGHGDTLRLPATNPRDTEPQQAPSQLDSELEPNFKNQTAPSARACQLCQCFTLVAGFECPNMPSSDRGGFCQCVRQRVPDVLLVLDAIFSGLLTSRFREKICLLHSSVKADLFDSLSLRDQLISDVLMSTVNFGDCPAASEQECGGVEH
jgi:hypothetical protein